MSSGEATRTTDRSIDVALAEFAALRSEIAASRQIQAGAVGVGLTAVGLIFGFALQEKGERQLLVVVPYVALLVSLLHLSETLSMVRQGEYIRRQLWPLLQRAASYPHSWEETKAANRTWSRLGFAALVLDGAVPFLFAGLSAVSVVLYYRENGTDIAVVAGCLAALLTLGFPILLARVLASSRAT